MDLILEISNTPNVDILQKSMHFSTTGGKIGRSQKATWTLNDPTKHISNMHAEVSYRDGQYYMTDISSNGMFFKTPHKKFVKGQPMPLDQKSEVVIGAYVISVKTIENAFMSAPAIGQSTPPTAGIPDTFFVGESHKEAFGVIESSSPENQDIVSLLGNDETFGTGGQEMMLPELDSIMGSYDNPEEMVRNDSLSTHIEAPTFNTPEPAPVATAQNEEREDATLKILALKLGVDVDEMSSKEKERFVAEVADLALTALEQVRQSHKSLEKIQSQLALKTGHQNALNPLKTAPTTKELVQNLHRHSPALSTHVVDLFQQIDMHNIAFYTAFKNISLRTAEKFSPERLHFEFEKKNRLAKSFTNKKALAWDAYCETFKHLDNMNDEEIDLSELQKEYNAVLETLSLQYNH